VFLERFPVECAHDLDEFPHEVDEKEMLELHQDLCRASTRVSIPLFRPTYLDPSPRDGPLEIGYAPMNFIASAARRRPR
jgi:hypothetical protein